MTCSIPGEAVPVASTPRKRRGRLIVLGLGLGFLACGLASWSWVEWTDWPQPVAAPLPDKVDALIVLGGGGEERVREAARLYAEGRAKKIIVTGDGGAIMTGLREAGVPDEALIHETEAATTWENARHVAPLLREMHARTAVLVTSWPHAPRAVSVFERAAPGTRFYASFEPRPSVPLHPWELEEPRKERMAALYYLVRYGIWCF